MNIKPTIAPINKPVSEIKPYANNPRNNVKSVEKVKASILQFGFKGSIIIDKDGYIIAGHTRYQAAIEIGYTELPCVVATDLTDEETRLLRIADNAVGEESKWDAAKLALEFESLKSTSFEHLPLLDLGLDEYLPPSLLGPLAEKEVSFKAKDGSKEISESEFDKFEHKCPRCNFEFNGN